jgi:hypothetical protein
VRFAKHGEFKAVGFDAGLAIVDFRTGDGYITVFNQFAAPLAGAEALRLQDAV